MKKKEKIIEKQLAKSRRKKRVDLCKKIWLGITDDLDYKDWSNDTSKAQANIYYVSYHGRKMNGVHIHQFCEKIRVGNSR